jgi:hypothetical protein
MLWGAGRVRQRSRRGRFCKGLPKWRWRFLECMVGEGERRVVHECGGCSCLRALDCEEGACKGLGEGLDEHEDGDYGEDDEGECPGVLEGEDEAGCEVLEEHPGC